MIAVSRRTHIPNLLAWSEGQQPHGILLHISHETGKFSQLLYCIDSNIVLDIIIIITVLDLRFSRGSYTEIGQLFLLLSVSSQHQQIIQAETSSVVLFHHLQSVSAGMTCLLFSRKQVSRDRCPGMNSSCRPLKCGTGNKYYVFKRFVVFSTQWP